MFTFLKELKNNNNKSWFVAHKEDYEKAKAIARSIFDAVHEVIAEIDKVNDVKIYRIYNDLRFAKNKPPYKDHFGAIIPRLQPYNRGSFYIHLEPGNNFVGGGFWAPNATDLLRIRMAFEYENEITQIINTPTFKAIYGTLEGEGLKTAPKGFDKNHERIEWIKRKQFLIRHSFTDKEVLSKDFAKQVAVCYEAALPFFRYMTDVLITDGNGELII